MSLPYFPLYVTDYEADTSHLTPEEDGIYMRLLRLMWMTPGCSVPDDPKWIARRLRVSPGDFDRAVAPIIDEFCCRKKGRVFSPRLMREFEKISDTRYKRSVAGKKGGRPRKPLKNSETTTSRAKSGEVHARGRPEPDPEPDPDKGDTPPSTPSAHVVSPHTPDTTPALPLVIEASAPAQKRKDENGRLFEEFWEAYPHRNGAKKGKALARKKFDAAIRDGTSAAEIIHAAARLHDDAQVLRGFAKDPATWLNGRGWDDEIEVAQPRDDSQAKGPRATSRFAKDFDDMNRALERRFGAPK